MQIEETKTKKKQLAIKVKEQLFNKFNVHSTYVY